MPLYGAKQYTRLDTKINGHKDKQCPGFFKYSNGSKFKQRDRIHLTKLVKNLLFISTYLFLDLVSVPSHIAVFAPVKNECETDCLPSLEKARQL